MQILRILLLSNSVVLLSMLICVFFEGINLFSRFCYFLVCFYGVLCDSYMSTFLNVPLYWGR